MNRHDCVTRAWLASLGLMLAPSAWSFQPLITDDTGTQGAGTHQMEMASGYQRDALGGGGGETTLLTVPLVFTSGLTNTLDLYASVANQRIHVEGGAGMVGTETGWSNVAVGAKWRFYENDVSRLSLGIRPEVQWPVSEDTEYRVLGMGRASYGVALIASQETAFGAVHFNLTVNRLNYALQANRDSFRADQYRVSIAPVWQVADSVKLALDLGIRSNPDVTQNQPLRHVEVGLVVSPHASMDLALGVIRNISIDQAFSVQALAGLTWRFK